MPKKLPEFITRIQAEGTAAEKRLVAEEVYQRAKELATGLPKPPYKQPYVGNLLRQALKGELDVDVFKEFVKMTNTYLEVERVAPRVRMLMRGGEASVSNTRGH